jgi:UDP:flavonoid glycosyltransferase YjiC (YdhE family)
MRVLFASLASVGHTYPLIPLAVAAREAGHEVHFAAGEEVHPPLAANGLNPFRPADAFYEIYAEDLAPELDRLRPDLVIHEWGLPGAATAARDAGIPGLWHGFGRMFPGGIGLERPVGGTHLDICPPSIQDKYWTASRIPLRPVPFSEPGEMVDGPLIYLTFGTAFGTAGLLTAAVDALAKLGKPVVVATGRVDPRELGPLPGNVTARKWLPQADLLPHADLVVHHGGSGTTLGALAAGVPQLVLPQGADQFANAAALADAGAAIVVEEAAAIADSAAAIDAGHRDAARAIADEIARLPAPADVARQLPDLAGR